MFGTGGDEVFLFWEMKTRGPQNEHFWERNGTALFSQTMHGLFASGAMYAIAVMPNGMKIVSRTDLPGGRAKLTLVRDHPDAYNPHRNSCHSE